MRNNLTFTQTIKIKNLNENCENVQAGRQGSISATIRKQLWHLIDCKSFIRNKNAFKHGSTFDKNQLKSEFTPTHSLEIINMRKKFEIFLKNNHLILSLLVDKKAYNELIIDEY